MSSSGKIRCKECYSLINSEEQHTAEKCQGAKRLLESIDLSGANIEKPTIKVKDYKYVNDEEIRHVCGVKNLLERQKKKSRKLKRNGQRKNQTKNFKRFREQIFKQPITDTFGKIMRARVRNRENWNVDDEYKARKLAHQEKFCSQPVGPTISFTIPRVRSNRLRKMSSNRKYKFGRRQLSVLKRKADAVTALQRARLRDVTKALETAVREHRNRTEKIVDFIDLTTSSDKENEASNNEDELENTQQDKSTNSESPVLGFETQIEKLTLFSGKQKIDENGALQPTRSLSALRPSQPLRDETNFQSAEFLIPQQPPSRRTVRGTDPPQQTSSLLTEPSQSSRQIEQHTEVIDYSKLPPMPQLRKAPASPLPDHQQSNNEIWFPPPPLTTLPPFSSPNSQAPQPPRRVSAHQHSQPRPEPLRRVSVRPNSSKSPSSQSLQPSRRFSTHQHSQPRPEPLRRISALPLQPSQRLPLALPRYRQEVNRISAPQPPLSTYRYTQPYHIEIRPRNVFSIQRHIQPREVRNSVTQSTPSQHLIVHQNPLPSIVNQGAAFSFNSQGLQNQFPTNLHRGNATTGLVTQNPPTSLRFHGGRMLTRREELQNQFPINIQHENTTASSLTQIPSTSFHSEDMLTRRRELQNQFPSNIHRENATASSLTQIPSTSFHSEDMLTRRREPQNQFPTHVQHENTTASSLTQIPSTLLNLHAQNMLIRREEPQNQFPTHVQHENTTASPFLQTPPTSLNFYCESMQTGAQLLERGTLDEDALQQHKKR